MSTEICITNTFTDASFTFYNANGSVQSLTIENTGVSGSYDVDNFVTKYNSDGTVLWAARMNTGYNNNISSCALDACGNVYVMGIFQNNTCTIYNSDGTLSAVPPIENINLDNNIAIIYIVKYDPNGTALWGTKLGGSYGYSGNYISVSLSINVDINNNVYVTGPYSDSSFNIYNSDGTSTLSLSNTVTDSNISDIFIVKYDPNGSAQWATRLGGDVGSTSFSLNVDINGNIYATGLYQDTSFNLYNSDGTLSTLTGLPLQNTSDSGSNTIDVFIVKYNTNGFADWGARLGSNYYNTGGEGSFPNIGFSIVLDQQSNVYVTGLFTDVSYALYNSDGNASSIILENTYGDLGYEANTFIVKYNSSGFAQWATKLGGVYSGQQYANGSIGLGITVDTNSNVYTTGIYSDTSLNIFNSDGSQAILHGLPLILPNTNPSEDIYSNANDTFIVKYNSDGNAQWGIRIGGLYQSAGRNISIDTSNNLYVSGYYTDPSFTLYNASGEVVATLPGYDDSTTELFFAKYDENGNYLWVTRMGNFTYSPFFLLSFGMAVNQYVLQPVPPVPDICFPAGTLILTDQGEVPIEKINAKYHTLGKKEIIAIIKTPNNEKKLVEIQAHAFGPNSPTKLTRMSKEHKIYYKGHMIEAKHFVGHFSNKVQYVNYYEDFLYNVLLRQHDKMIVNNLIVETLHPLNASIKRSLNVRNKLHMRLH